ncbi:DUF599 domain-containing protein [Saccharobesus litoralis]|uniref:DUF599 domain-containing protein n=1 Tax=Saccharobesus litoralis TaxID=2172099 RepID=A0A2S0VSN8_9ALTE|nr:DUF599 domain-containing protein [Saccharobesus litoralis]AWB67236.1 DUF599 domain-containing protein [Saccharobesus litoralis]
MGLDLLDVISLAVFMFVWYGYTIFARGRAKRTTCLSSVLIIYRIDWMRHLLERDNRILDAALMGNIEKNINFFASTTLLIIAGALTAMASADTLQQMTQTVDWVDRQTEAEIQFKLLFICAILVFTFFKFTWALRQYGFAGVMIGAAPNHNDPNATIQMKRAFARNAGKIIDQAMHNFNNGLRAYYFALAALGWFINPFVFIGLGLAVVYVLYRREFYSRTLKMLEEGLVMSSYYLSIQQEKQKEEEKRQHPTA